MGTVYAQTFTCGVVLHPEDTVKTTVVTGDTPEEGYCFDLLKDDAFAYGIITVTTVAEPETYILLLAGLAAVGFIHLRRRAIA